MDGGSGENVDRRATQKISRSEGLLVTRGTTQAMTNTLGGSEDDANDRRINQSGNQ